MILPETEDPETLCKRFSNWLDNALPGDKFCYYFGKYVAGNVVGGLAMKAYENGRITLFQQRQGTKFSYWAQARRNY